MQRQAGGDATAASFFASFLTAQQERAATGWKGLTRAGLSLYHASGAKSHISK